MKVKPKEEWCKVDMDGMATQFIRFGCRGSDPKPMQDLTNGERYAVIRFAEYCKQFDLHYSTK